jgi:hypothetical protein
MEDVVVIIENGALNRNEFLSGKDVVSCVNCALLNVNSRLCRSNWNLRDKLLLFYKKIMNTLKKELMQNNTSGNTGLTNIYINMKKEHSHLWRVKVAQKQM